MTEPAVYVSTWNVKEGKVDAYARFHQRLAHTVRDLEPRHMTVLADQMGILSDMGVVTDLLGPGQIDVYLCGTRSARRRRRPLSCRSWDKWARGR